MCEPIGKKYVVEGGLDFFAELNKSIKAPGTNTVEECLITNEPLTHLHVTLDCGHKFNYLPLYNEVKNQKNGKNFLEVTRLQVCEVKCPYCRKINSGILPFHESLKEVAPRLHGVNSSYTSPSSSPIAKTTKSKVVVNKPVVVKKPLSISVPVEVIACTQLLKTGLNKGNPCNKPACMDGLCMRHYNLSAKTVTNEPVNK